MSVSPPSSEKRLWPMYLVWINDSSASASFSFSRMRRFISGAMGSWKRTGSTRSISQRFSAGDEMCINSTPTLRV